MKQLISILAFTFLTSGCFLTINQGLQPIIHAKKQTAIKTAAINFSYEQVGFTGTRIIFTKEQSESMKSELVDVLKEFGISENEANPDIKIEASLKIKDAGCEVLFIPSNCNFTLIAQPLTLYLVPSAFSAEHEVTMKFDGLSKISKPVIESELTKSHFHLLLLPTFPFELWNLTKAEYRKNTYRKILTQNLEIHSKQPSQDDHSARVL